MSSEYGWTDEVIGNLPLGRFRQITAAIQTRRYFQERAENSRISWLTRTLAGYIVGGYMAEAKDKQPSLDAISQLSLDDVEAEYLRAGAGLPAPAKSAEPRAGSFERLMGLMGPGGSMDQRGKMI